MNNGDKYVLHKDVQLLQRAKAIGLDIDKIYNREQLQQQLLSFYYSGKYASKNKLELEDLLDTIGWNLGPV